MLALLGQEMQHKLNGPWELWVALGVCLIRRLVYLVVHGQSIGQVDHFRREGAEDEGG